MDVKTLKTIKHSALKSTMIAMGLMIFIHPIGYAQLDHKGLNILDKAESVLGESFNLPESQWFGRDKTSANADIDDYLDDLIERLELPALVSLRKNYFKVEKKLVKNVVLCVNCVKKDYLQCQKNLARL